MAGQAGLFRCVCRVDLNIAPLDRPGEDGGEGTVVGDHTGRGQRFPVGGDSKSPGGLHPHGLGDSVSGFPVDGLALYGLLDGGPADAGAVGKSGQSSALRPDPLPQVDFAEGSSPVADPLLLEVLVKAVNVAGTEVTEPDMAEGLVDPLKVLRVGGYSFRLEIQLGVLCHVLLRKVGKAHVAVGGGPGQDLFLEQDRLSL